MFLIVLILILIVLIVFNVHTVLCIFLYTRIPVSASEPRCSDVFSVKFAFHICTCVLDNKIQFNSITLSC